jgi:hypothetical protein
LVLWYGKVEKTEPSEQFRDRIARRGIQKFLVKILVRGVGDPDLLTIKVRPLPEVSVRDVQILIQNKCSNFVI